MSVTTPLSGLRVLDLSQGIAGPYTATILAQQGADVVKIEPPQGDWARLMGTGKEGMTAMSIACNLGKRSLCVDARHPKGTSLLRRLALESDLIVESFRPGVLAKFGLDDASLRPSRPGLIYASITGFGQDGPWRDRPGADSVIQALSGMMWMNQDAAGQPRRIGMMMIDVTTGCYAAQGITAALFHHARTGEGQRLSFSLLGTAAALQSIPIVNDTLEADAARVPATVPSGTFRTSNGALNLTTLRNRMFHGLAQALERPDWIENPAYHDNAGRLRHAKSLNEAIQAVLERRPTDYWLHRLRIHDVLCAPVLEYADFLAHPQVRHASLFAMVEQTPWGSLPLARLPHAAATAPASAPSLGQDTRDILLDAGLDPAQIDALRHQGVVYEPQDLPADLHASATVDRA